MKTKLVIALFLLLAAVFLVACGDKENPPQGRPVYDEPACGPDLPEVCRIDQGDQWGYAEGKKGVTLDCEGASGPQTWFDPVVVIESDGEPCEGWIRK